VHCNPRGLAEAEKAARRNSATDTAKTVHQARVSTGSLRPGELPIKNYDTLTIGDAVAQVQTLTNPADVRAIIGYEENHKNRYGIVSAAQTHLAGIAKDVAGII